MMDEPDHSGLVGDMARFIDEQFGGSVTRPLVVALTTAILARSMLRGGDPLPRRVPAQAGSIYCRVGS